MTRAFRDYIALEELPDGSVRPLGAFSAKVGNAFEVASQFFPEPFLAGRGRIEVDQKSAVAELAEKRAALRQGVERAWGPRGGQVDSGQHQEIADTQ